MPAVARRIDRSIIDSVIPEGLVVFATTTYAMRARDLVISADTSGGAWTLTLPPVHEAAGLLYTIKLRVGAAAGAAPNALTIRQQGSGSVRWMGNILLRRPGQVVSLLSDGEQWHRVYASTGVKVPQSKGFHEMWELPFVVADAADGGPPAATGKHMITCASGNVFTMNSIVGQTLTGPAWDDPGIDIGMDQTDNDGVELCVPLGANSPHNFVIGTDPAFFCRARLSIADVSGTDDMLVGFRRREAFQAAVDDYADMAALNVISGALNIETILNGAATVTTDTTNTWADAATHTLEVRVSAAGVVTYLYDDVAPATVAAFTFDNGDPVVPFIYALQAADLSGDIVILEWECGYQA